MSEPRLPVPIFVAEDNPADVVLLRQALKEHGTAYRLSLASDGAQALQYLEGCSESTLPALILLDLNLPKQDGLEVLQQIRQDPRLAAIPVIILTSSDSKKDRLTALELGVARYIHKSFSLEEAMALAVIMDEVLAASLLSAADRSGE